MDHLSGHFAVIRASLGRALAVSAVLAGALLLAGCYEDVGYQLPTRAMKELSPQMVALLQQKNMPEDSPILVRIFKEESELEVWKQDSTGHFELLKVYPICRWSGDLGPKVKEGDRQAPEGFYPITPGLMNPNSNYYLAINTGFPNAYDRANGYKGAFLMIHGDCSSRGCYAMTDEEIGEIYSLARDSFLGGQKEFQVQAYPFRMTPANLARHRNSPNMAFWKMIKEGDDHFLVSHLEPKVDVCDRHYVFDAEPPAGSTKALVFTPTGRCPVYEVNPAIAGLAQQKEQNDDYQYAQLVRQDVPVAPLVTNTDGGMNRVFLAKLDTAAYTYDNDGHLHVPPLQPGRLPPAISPPRGSETETSPAIAAAPGQESPGSIFSGLFSSHGASESTQVATSDAAAPAQQQSSFFGSLFKSKSEGAPPSDAAPPTDTEEQTASIPAAKPKPGPRTETASAVGLRLKTKTDAQKIEAQKTDAHKSAPQQAQTANPAAPQQEASAVMKGAQAPMPSGSFDSRWGALQ